MLRLREVVEHSKEVYKVDEYGNKQGLYQMYDTHYGCLREEYHFEDDRKVGPYKLYYSPDLKHYNNARHSFEMPTLFEEGVYINLPRAQAFFKRFNLDGTEREEGCIDRDGKEWIGHDGYMYAKKMYEKVESEKSPEKKAVEQANREKEEIESIERQKIEAKAHEDSFHETLFSRRSVLRMLKEHSDTLESAWKAQKFESDTEKSESYKEHMHTIIDAKFASALASKKSR